MAPPIDATAAIAPSRAPEGRFRLLSAFEPARLTLSFPTAFADGERLSAITGPLTSEPAAKAAKQILLSFIETSYPFGFDSYIVTIKNNKCKCSAMYI
jgi:hypothetical protein